MQRIVADQARAAKAGTRVGRRRVHGADGGVPIERNAPLALAPADQHVEPLHRRDQFEALNEPGRDGERVVALKVVELGGVFALDRGDPQGLAPAVRFAFSRPPRGGFLRATARRSSW